MDINSDTKSVEQSLNALVTRLADSDSLDTQNRRAVQKAAQKLIDTVETPGDIFHRIAFLVKLRFPVTLLRLSPHTNKPFMSHQPLQATVVRIALDLGLFEILGKAGPSGKSINELENDTGADPVFLSLSSFPWHDKLLGVDAKLHISARLLRHLASTGVVDQADQVHFVATPISKALSDPVSQAGVKHT